MRKMIIAAAVAAPMALTGCQTFLGTNDPCQQAEVLYSGFLTFAATNGKVSKKAYDYAATGIVAIREQCSDGHVEKVTLNKALRVYAAALTAYRQGRL